MTRHHKEIDKQLVESIERVLREFTTLSGVDSAVVESDITPEGRFDLHVRGDHRSIRVRHERTYDSAGTIDIEFVNRDLNQSYVTIMTECDTEEFPALLDNALVLSKNFLAGRGRVEDKRLLGVFRRTYLVFDEVNLVYDSAILSGRAG